MSLSKANNSLGSRTAAVGNMGAAIVAHMARSICSRIAAVICNWKGLYFSGQKPSTQVESNRWDSDTKLVFFQYLSISLRKQFIFRFFTVIFVEECQIVR